MGAESETAPERQVTLTFEEREELLRLVKLGSAAREKIYTPIGGEQEIYSKLLEKLN